MNKMEMIPQDTLGGTKETEKNQQESDLYKNARSQMGNFFDNFNDPQ